MHSGLTDEKIRKMSNNNLCRALGTYNNDGAVILKIHAELGSRAAEINNEKCHAMEIQGKEKQRNDDIPPSTYKPDRAFPYKTDEIITQMLDKMIAEHDL